MGNNETTRFIKCQVKILPTSISSIYQEEDGSLHVDKILKSYGGVNHYHFNILSNEEIKMGDFILTDENKIIRANCFGKFSLSEKFIYPSSKKIIATTDESLALPLIPNTFIKENLFFNKNRLDFNEAVVEYEVENIKRGEIKGLEFNPFDHIDSLPPVINAEFKLKLTPDNYINIKIIKSMYRKEELPIDAMNAIWYNIIGTYSQSLKYPEEVKLAAKQILSWLEQNNLAY